MTGAGAEALNDQKSSISGQSLKPDETLTSKSKSFINEVRLSLEFIADKPQSVDNPEVKAFIKDLGKKESKFIYMLTILSIMALFHFLVIDKWFITYYYTVATPLLLIARLKSFWKLHYQFFLLDFCYFACTFFYLYIWVWPERADIFALCFSAANGPMLWALFIFRNSLVFHSLDKITSAYIHSMPSILSYVIRWYPEETSKYWHKEFPRASVDKQYLTLLLAPMVLALIHLICYSILVQLIIKPSEKYQTIFRQMHSNEKSLMYKCINLCGPRYQYLMYCFWWTVSSAVLMSFNLIWYNYYYAHLTVLALFHFICLYNGATYYMDVFRINK